jgi:formate dehydrogenase maturation protein FdhE
VNQKRDVLVGLKVRPREHAALLAAARRKKTGSLSQLIRLALDELLGTNWAEEAAAESRGDPERLKCPACGRPGKDVEAPPGHRYLRCAPCKHRWKAW